MKEYDHPQNPELPIAARNPNRHNLFQRFVRRRRFDRIEREFDHLADRTACLLIDRLAEIAERKGMLQSGIGEVHPEKIAPWSDIDGPVYHDAPTSGGGPAREIAADLFRLNDLLDVLKVNSILSRTLRLWVCIRRYDGLCVVAGNFGREAKKKQDAHRTSC